MRSRASPLLRWPSRSDPASREDEGLCSRAVSSPPPDPVPLTSLGHGGGCGCKIAPGLLQDILRRTSVLPAPPELLVDASTSDDAAVYLLNERQALVATTDFFLPIVDDPHTFGRIAATNALSDVYAMGGTPILALAVVGMPVATLGPERIAAILEGGQSVCREAGIPLAGGHTIDSAEPIYGLVALGLVEPARLRRNADARPGDVLVLGKPLGVGVLSAALRQQRLSAERYDSLVATTTLLNTPGPALAALDGVHALTDVTGFGLAGHALEIARGSELDIDLHWSAVPLLDGAAELAAAGMVTGASGRNWAAYGADVALPDGFGSVDQALLSDPQTSGGLLVSCRPEALEVVLQVFHDRGFAAAAAIGEVRPRQPQGRRLRLR